ncbi:histidine kinase dimerization/phospho-acceptor domain-containing protein, partial [Lysinibacillus fusiformis]|uniref:histidine kinase dimerization/phospho-acceptor domain-containing protein n=1 Tax=Lysinibacillus fusiformis TaxID=28031 RepID=UPI0023ED568A
LKQFMVALTHELNTPLALINVYSSGMEDGIDDGTYLSVIHQQIDRMEFRSQMAFVLQDPFLFETSVRENIRY